MSQILPSSNYTVQVSGGSLQTLPLTGFFYLSTAKTTAGNGQSLLQALTTALNASSGLTWTLSLDANLKVKFVHNSGAAQTVTMGGSLLSSLGFHIGTGPGTQTYTPFATGAGGTTAENRCLWLWEPGQVYGDAGPELFDPTVNAGSVRSAGAAARAPDSTASFVTNGIQVQATYTFVGVSPFYRAKPTLDSGGYYMQWDFETWWINGPALGRKIIMWRDQSNLVNQSAPSSNNVVPLKYLEYYPDDSMRAQPDLNATKAPNLYWWDITLSLWKSELGDVTY
jgi:hypothetical protein